MTHESRPLTVGERATPAAQLVLAELQFRLERYRNKCESTNTSDEEANRVRIQIAEVKSLMSMWLEGPHSTEEDDALLPE